MTYLLDTDMFTLAYYSKRGVRERIEIEQSLNTVAISIVTWAEVIRGRCNAILKAADEKSLISAQDGLRSTEEYMKQFRIVPFDSNAGKELVRLRKLKLPGKPGLADLMHASVSHSQRATLVTRNTKDFAGIPGLKLENWAA